MPTTEGPNAVRAILKRTHPHHDVVKRGGSWFVTGPGTELLYTTSLSTYRLDGDPRRWVEAIKDLLAPSQES